MYKYEKNKKINVVIYQILAKKGNIFFKEHFIDTKIFKDCITLLIESGYECQTKVIHKEVIL